MYTEGKVAFFHSPEVGADKIFDRSKKNIPAWDKDSIPKQSENEISKYRQKHTKKRFFFTFFCTGKNKVGSVV